MKCEIYNEILNNTKELDYIKYNYIPGNKFSIPLFFKLIDNYDQTILYKLEGKAFINIFRSDYYSFGN